MAACVGSEAQAPNAPVFEAGTASPVAGSYSPFVLQLKREDASQRFSGLNVTLPPGLIGKIAGIEQCPQAAIEAAQGRSHEGEGAVELAHPSCPAGSEVGVVHVGTGSGAPYYVAGHAYFAGPYEGAPFSLVIVTPALAGPFDFGSVVVRAALYINPSTAQVTVKSDPFPTILDGDPARHSRCQRGYEPQPIHVEPDELRDDGRERGRVEHGREYRGLVGSFSGRWLCEPAIQTVVHGLHAAAKASRADGASLDVKISIRECLGEANVAKVRRAAPQAAPVASVDAAEGVSPRRSSTRTPRGARQRRMIGTATVHTPILACAVDGPGVFRLPWQRGVPEAGARAAGRRRHDRSSTVDTDIKNKITYYRVRSGPRCPVSRASKRTRRQGPHSVPGVEASAGEQQPLRQNLQMPSRSRARTVTSSNRTSRT